MDAGFPDLHAAQENLRPRLAWLLHGLSFPFGLPRLSLPILLQPGCLLASVGGVPALATHAAGALLILFAVGFWPSVDLPFVGSVHWGWLGVPLAFFWVVGLTNAYNFMDGIDGLAGSQAVIAGVGWAGLGWLRGEPLVSLLGLLVAGSSLGFLLHNWPPARIFMGDVGSAFLGFTFAALSVLAAQQNPRLAVAGILLLWPFIFDTIGTFLRRLRRRENVFAAHRSHLYQRLVIAGYSHRTVTLLYSGLALVGLVLALVWVLALPGADWLALGLPGLLGFGLWQFVVRAETASLALQRATPPVGDSP